MSKQAKILYLLAAALALAWMGYTVLGPGGARRHGLQRQLDRLQQMNRELEQSNQRLRAEIEALRRRDDYLERLARERLGLVAPGELVLRLPGPDDAAASSSAKPAGGEPDGRAGDGGR